MLPEKEIKKIENSAVRMTVTLKKADVQAGYETFIKDLLKDIALPGFRRGKVPRAVLETKAGGTLKEDALNRLIGDATTTLLRSEDFPKELQPLPYSDPQLEEKDLKLDLDKDLAFNVTYDIMPEVTVKKWSGLSVETPEASVSDKDLERELEKLRDRNAVVMERNDGEASKKGDVVTVNYCELENGGVKGGTERQDFVFELGSGKNVYAFDAEITGMKAGETREFDKDYAGKKVKLRVKVTSVKKKDLPDLDDELAQDIDEKYKTLNDLKQDLRQKLEKQLENRLDAERNKAIIAKIVENSPITLPKSMLDYEVYGRVSRMFGGRLPEGFANNSSFMDEARKDAEDRIRNSLIIEKLIEENHIEATDADVEAEYQNFASNSGEDLEKVKEYFKSNPNMLEEARATVKEHKLFKLLAEKNTIKKGKKVSYLDLFPDNA